MNARDQFPILKQKINGYPLIYLDSAATSQKPESVIVSESQFYNENNANIHRAPHELAERATNAYEGVRRKVKSFINSKSTDEIIFTKGTTDSINLVANSLSQFFLSKNSEILLTDLEHHSNIVPWQMAASKVGAKVIACKVTRNGEIDLSDFENKLNSNTSVVSFATVSNALGTVHPVEQLISLVRLKSPKALILLDAAQSVAHMKTDVSKIDADFVVFSSHKLYGPTGVGILYGKKELLLKMPPATGGGDMIEKVSFSGTSYALPPYRFEAGTPNIAGVIGFGAALDFIQSFTWEEITKHENCISELLISELSKIENLTVIGNPKRRMSALSFIVKDMDSLDVAVRLNQLGIAVRSGHHCCMPLMEALRIPGTVRASWGIYTSEEDVRYFAQSLRNIASNKFIKNQIKGDITFTQNNSASINDSVEELKSIFSEASEDRADILLELGAAHPRRLSELRKIAPEVSGCMSEVRVVTKLSKDGRLYIASDSNSEIVRGLLAVVEKVFSGQLIEEIRKIDPKKIISELDLLGFISIQRRAGFESVLKIISESY